ncbi:hypothetical protein [Pedobacter sp. L105]|uniref:hypothetical protein n=1 Tax=Pedobacter sp. L105 TaxID=1641871 RepID=UPI00131BAD9D|nr:hypothetical protein [Pedobacter sp. L105]
MGVKKSKWKKNVAIVTAMVAVGGLVVSLISNYNQCAQLGKANLLAAAQSSRAAQEAQQVKELKRQKTNRIDELNNQLTVLVHQMDVLQQHLKLEQDIGQTQQNYEVRQKAIENAEANAAELHQLEWKKSVVEQQINELMSD